LAPAERARRRHHQYLANLMAGRPWPRMTELGGWCGAAMMRCVGGVIYDLSGAPPVHLNTSADF
jgi:hypothetical protein